MNSTVPSPKSQYPFTWFEDASIKVIFGFVSVVGWGYACKTTSGNSLTYTLTLPLILCATHPLLSITSEIV